MWLSLGKGWISSYCRLPAELHRIAGTAQHGGMEQASHTSWTPVAAPGIRSLPLATLTEPSLSPIAPGIPNGHG